MHEFSCCRSEPGGGGEREREKRVGRERAGISRYWIVGEAKKKSRFRGTGRGILRIPRFLCHVRSINKAGKSRWLFPFVAACLPVSVKGAAAGSTRDERFRISPVASRHARETNVRVPLNACEARALLRALRGPRRDATRRLADLRIVGSRRGGIAMIARPRRWRSDKRQLEPDAR